MPSALHPAALIGFPVSPWKCGSCSEVRGPALETCDGSILLSFGTSLTSLVEIVAASLDGIRRKMHQTNQTCIIISPSSYYFSSTNINYPSLCYKKNAMPTHCPPSHSAPIRGLLGLLVLFLPDFMERQVLDVKVGLVTDSKRRHPAA